MTVSSGRYGSEDSSSAGYLSKLPTSSLGSKPLKTTVASSVIRRDRERVMEAERMCRQLVAVAKAKGLMVGLPSAGPDYGEALRTKWRVLSSNPDIAAATVNVEGLVGPNDALIILDRTITSDLPRE